MNNIIFATHIYEVALAIEEVHRLWYLSKIIFTLPKLLHFCLSIFLSSATINLLLKIKCRKHLFIKIQNNKRFLTKIALIVLQYFFFGSFYSYLSFPSFVGQPSHLLFRLINILQIRIKPNNIAHSSKQ